MLFPAAMLCGALLAPLAASAQTSPLINQIQVQNALQQQMQNQLNTQAMQLQQQQNTSSSALQSQLQQQQLQLQYQELQQQLNLQRIQQRAHSSNPHKPPRHSH